MKIINYVFWKNVHHNFWLYNMAFFYFFCLSSQFRAVVRLHHACRYVELQDASRVRIAELRQQLKAITDVIRGLTDFMAIINNQKAINK